MIISLIRPRPQEFSTVRKSFPHSVKPESVFKMWKTRSKCGKLLRTVENSCGRGRIKLIIILHLLWLYYKSHTPQMSRLFVNENE